jgi:hypothetical protein
MFQRLENDVASQELLSLRESAHYCGHAASRWWTEYDVELTEWTGYPIQRNQSDVREMTEAEVLTAVIWVRAQPLFNYDGSCSSNQISEDDDIWPWLTNL